MGKGRGLRKRPGGVSAIVTRVGVTAGASTVPSLAGGALRVPPAITTAAATATSEIEAIRRVMRHGEYATNGLNGTGGQRNPNTLPP